jgi:hypothetical protein
MVTVGNRETNLVAMITDRNKGYENSIAGKISDFTSKTIKHLLYQGKEDASDLLNGSKGTPKKS